MREKLIEYLQRFDSVQETGKSWQQLADEFGFPTKGAAKSYWNRHKNKNLQSYCKSKGIDYSTVVSAQYVGKKDYWNLYVKPQLETFSEDFISQIDIKIPTSDFTPTVENKDASLMVSFSDQHIGMDIRNPLFLNCKEWNIDIYESRLKALLSVIASEVIANDPDHLYITMLGDYTDGLNAYTTRGSHKLPQNMNNREMFDNGVNTLIQFIHDLTQFISIPITINFISNSNHGGIMDYTIGQTIKKVVEVVYNYNIEFNVLSDFINVAKIRNKDFLLTHGYDEQYVTKNKFPKVLDSKWIAKVEGIIRSRQLNNVYLYRGDLHQYKEELFNLFTDVLVPAFSPPSDYIQHNFMNDYEGGFVTSVITDKEVFNKRYDFRNYT